MNFTVLGIPHKRTTLLNRKTYILYKRLNILNKDGCLPSKEVGSKVYLKDTEYEFVYKRIKFSKTETERYKQLQKKYNKKPYYQYDYV